MATNWGANMFLLVENSGTGLSFNDIFKFVDDYTLATCLIANILVAFVSILLAVYLD